MFLGGNLLPIGFAKLLNAFASHGELFHISLEDYTGTYWLRWVDLLKWVEVPVWLALILQGVGTI